MDGIELDPASSHAAQQIVQAERYYTQEDDGLSVPWVSRSVWLNPPYRARLVSQFVFKLIYHYERGDIKGAILLVNNATETKWFQAAISRAQCMCLPLGRIQFLKPDGTTGPPLQGQALIYFGPYVSVFERAFSKIGTICFF
jgi:ParB family chromosome partitioning protein